MNAPAPAVIGSNSLIAAYKPFREIVAEMRKANAEKAFNYEDPTDNKAARSHVHKMRQAKGEIKRVHDAEKKDVLDLGRRIDGQCNELIAEIDALILVHQKPLDEIAEREERRLQSIKDTLASLLALSAKADPFGGTYAIGVLKQNLATVEAMALDADVFRESLADAERAKSDAATVLRSHIAEAERREAEAAELERLRQAEEQRQQQEREERIRQEARKEAEERAARAAEEERAAAVNREAALRQAAETAERERRESEERAQRERVEAEARAAREREEAAAREARIARETEERVAREARERQEREQREAAAREADKKHRTKINNAAVAALVDGGLSEAAAKSAVTLIAQQKIPHVSISY